MRFVIKTALLCSLLLAPACKPRTPAEIADAEHQRKDAENRRINEVVGYVYDLGFDRTIVRCAMAIAKNGGTPEEADKQCLLDRNELRRTIREHDMRIAHKAD